MPALDRQSFALAGCVALLLAIPGSATRPAATSAGSGAHAPLALPFEHGSFHALFVKAEVNGREAVLLLDTGARFSVVRPEIVGMSPADLGAARFAPEGPGFRGEAIGLRTTVRLGHKVWRDHLVSVMDLSEVDKAYGRRVDGLLGEDLLCKFRRVELDYPGKLIVLTP